MGYVFFLVSSHVVQELHLSRTLRFGICLFFNVFNFPQIGCWFVLLPKGSARVDGEASLHVAQAGGLLINGFMTPVVELLPH